MTNNQNYDLPLLANVKEILVHHYILDLSCNFQSKTFEGSAILFLNPLPLEIHESIDEKDNFQFILDMRDIDIKSVEEINYPIDRLQRILDRNMPYPCGKETVAVWFSYPKCKLNYEVKEWSLNVWKNGCVKREDFPRVICIQYETMAKGESLTWSRDQNGMPCVYTQGAMINNRSLLPCQEPPVAMATWQACIKTNSDGVVLMTGDEDGEMIECNEKGFVKYYFYTQMVLPISTLALAIGYWKMAELITKSEAVESSVLVNKKAICKCLHTNYPCYMLSELDTKLIPCKLFATEGHIGIAKKIFSCYILRCLTACHSLLGRHPFLRMDILIVPRSFASLGLASPHLLLISQSLLCEDGSACINLAHEISHSWFGLSIGALDWTEEWLSEGFATYMEDKIHAMAMGWSQKETEERSELRALLRYHLLRDELQETDSELQVLRPNSGEVEKSVINGLNPWKCFSQVHYLKGYFLLNHLSCIVGDGSFLKMLKEYVTRNHGCLVLSKEIFQLYFELFKDVKNLSMSSIYSDWLDIPGMPKCLGSYTVTDENNLYGEVLIELRKWKCINRNYSKRRKKSKLKIEFKKLDCGDQLILLLEFLLAAGHLFNSTMTALNSHFEMERRNCHVRHRWCELVIKNNYQKGLSEVKHFLHEDQAMGIYLYGELILSKHRTMNEIARSCFNQLQCEMDNSSRKSVAEMLGIENKY